jgi:hypothetical protein
MQLAKLISAANKGNRCPLPGFIVTRLSETYTANASDEEQIEDAICALEFSSNQIHNATRKLLTLQDGVNRD